MPYLIVVDHSDPASWVVINHIFPAPPNPVNYPVQYTSLTNCAPVTVVQDLGNIPIVNANTGANGTGRLIQY